MNKKSIFIIVLAILASLLIYRHTFFMALVGDDYLGLWRLIDTFRSDAGWNYFNYFLTDYGPQDTITLIISSLFGFRHWIFYFTAFLMRIGAALSLIPLIFYITKSKAATFWSFFFFLISYTGIETNDWSFNMPSFLSIIAINFHILYLLRTLENNVKNKLHFILSLLLMILAVILQPIRATFLPGFTMLAVIYYLLTKKGQKVSRSALYIIIVTLSVYLLIAFSQIGVIFGIPQDQYARLTLHWFDPQNSNFARLFGFLKMGDIQILLNPVIQIGEIFFPFVLLPKRLEVLNTLTELFSLVTIQFFLYSILISVVKVHNKSKYILAAAVWVVFSLALFSSQFRFPAHSTMIFGLINGGFIIISILPSLLSGKHRITMILLIFLVLSFIAPWIRQPDSYQIANSRYLIISASGVAILLALFMHNSKSKFTYMLVVLFIAMHFVSSYKYFNFLTQVRDTNLVQSIRDSLPYNPKVLVEDEVVMYYLESDNPDILYHSIGFGLPVLLYFQQGVVNPWDIAVTDKFSDVVSAVTDGQSLVRFNIEKRPIPIENIFSLRLSGGKLIDTTQATREDLTMKLSNSN